VNERLADGKKHMEKAIEHFRTEVSKLRVGRATTAMVEGVRVEVYGSSMTMKEVAALATPDAKSITIQPWDKSVIGEIEKAILAANLGLTPMNDGKLIRINLPPLTEDRRKDFVKQIKKYGEDTKVAVRNARREAMDKLKKDKDDGKHSEDELKRLEGEIQKTTDHFTAETDKLVEAKSKEVMTL
jgi:ribosome recycling factor